jgi:hypothetical protein
MSNAPTAFRFAPVAAAITLAASDLLPEIVTTSRAAIVAEPSKPFAIVVGDAAGSRPG